MYVLLVENRDGFCNALYHGGRDDLYARQLELEIENPDDVYEIQFVQAVVSQ